MNMIDDIIGQRIECSWNLHKRLYSLRKNGKVVGYAANVVMRDVRFIINARLQQRFKATGVRTVHAWLRGTLAGFAPVPIEKACTVRCNPYEFDSFANAADATPIQQARVVNLHATRWIEAGGLS
jgi:hypothetical protein